MSYDVRYGQIRGGEQGFMSLLAISQTIYATDFKLVTISGGTATIAASSAVKFAGVMEVEPIPNSVNTGTSKGTEIRKVINDPTAIYRIPIISGTYSDATYLGVRCDYTNGGAGSLVAYHQFNFWGSNLNVMITGSLKISSLTDSASLYSIKYIRIRIS